MTTPAINPTFTLGEQRVGQQVGLLLCMVNAATIALIAMWLI